MDSLEKKVFELKAQIQMKLSEKNYQDLVSNLIKLKQNLKSLQ